MDRPARISLAYAVAFVAFFLVPAAFRSQAPAPIPTGVYWQEVVDLFTPVVLIPLSWYLCSFEAPGLPSSRFQRLVFLVLAALWVEGQGMHLAANSIGRPWENAPSPSGDLTHFYDEVLSHYVWHLGLDGLWGLAIVRSVAAPYREGRLPARTVALAAGILGVAWFMVLIESGTGPLDIPLTIAGLAFVVLRRDRVQRAPVAAILGGAAALTLVMIGVWALRWGGDLPQFSQVGLL